MIFVVSDTERDRFQFGYTTDKSILAEVRYTEYLLLIKFQIYFLF